MPAVGHVDIDPLADFLKRDIPIMAGVSEKDTHLPVETALYLEEQFREAGKSGLILKIYPESDHR